MKQSVVNDKQIVDIHIQTGIILYCNPAENSFFLLHGFLLPQSDGYSDRSGPSIPAG